MEPGRLLNELFSAARKLGLRVRVEAFDTPSLGGGGLCWVYGRQLVLLDENASQVEQAAALAEALAAFDTEPIYMAPEARGAIEAARERHGMPPGVRLQKSVPLAPRTTLGVGGPAQSYVEASDESSLLTALSWAEQRGVQCQLLGGGSNVVVADAGFDGLVVHIATQGIEWEEHGDAVQVTVAAGESWDRFAALSVERSWVGLECLSGIPGQVGATPIQNVGAYGQEVADTILSVRAYDRSTGKTVSLPSAACEFGYRDSVFKSGAPHRYVVLAVTFRLRIGAPPSVRYAQLAEHLRARGLCEPSLLEVRESVLEIRRSKSMVYDTNDPNGRSCGSFFTNPIVSPERLEELLRRSPDRSPPQFPQPEGTTKLSAGWLIEHAGFARGYRDGAVGLSSAHALALVCHPGAQARDVVRLAHRIQARVLEQFGVTLHPEPAFWGFSELTEGLPKQPDR
jgi:UDP-N-acetylmuramate dehydrogenase